METSVTQYKVKLLKFDVAMGNQPQPQRESYQWSKDLRAISENITNLIYPNHK